MAIKMSRYDPVSEGPVINRTPAFEFGSLCQDYGSADPDPKEILFRTPVHRADLNIAHVNNYDLWYTFYLITTNPTTDP
jgi:hypothetical protein